MINDIATLLVPVILISAGYYIKIAKEKEPYATPSMWKWLIGIGVFSLIVDIILLLIRA